MSAMPATTGARFHPQRLLTPCRLA
jgi:hypothetical protein